tara:strand:+ start:646 stop:846 length:201 start_codon:yes stop_codon:yes gene_type:complete
MKTKFEIEKEYNSEYGIFDAKQDFKDTLSEICRKELKEYNPNYRDNNINDTIIDCFLDKIFDKTKS